MHQGEPQDEYKDVSDNIRLFQTVRFAKLTVFIAVSGALIGAVFSSPVAASSVLKIVFRLGGFFVTLLFWVLQEGTMLYWRHFVRRASELEEILGYRQYTTRPRAGLFTGTNAIRGFFVLLGALWVALLFTPG